MMLMDILKTNAMTSDDETTIHKKTFKLGLLIKIESLSTYRYHRGPPRPWPRIVETASSRVRLEH